MANIIDFEYGRGPFDQTVAVAANQQSSVLVTDAAIDDNTTSLFSLWSSSKIQNEIAAIEDAGVTSIGSPEANQIAIWTDPTTATGDIGLTWANNRLDVRGESSASNGTKIISMRHDGVGRGTLYADDELLISAENTVIGSTSNHLQLQYSAGGFRNGTLFFDDTDFIIGTDDYGALDTRLKLAPQGGIVWTPVGTNIGIGTETPSHALDVNSDSIRVRTPKTPASPIATGTTGEIAWDANSLFICTDTNQWKHSPLQDLGTNGFLTVETKSEDYTANESDFQKYIRFTGGTLTLFDTPTAKIGGVIYVRNQSGITMMIQSGASTVNGLNELDNGETVSIIAVGQNEFDIIGGR